MKVAFDDEIFTRQRRGGVSRYFVELLRAFPEVDSALEVSTPWRWVTNQHALDAGIGRRLPGGLGQRGSVARWANVPSLVKERADAWHFTYYQKGRRALAGKGLRIASLYDMIPERFPELFRAGSPHGDKQAVLESADLILSISQSAADDLSLRYKVAAPIRITPLGVGLPFLPGKCRLPQLERPYVLFVGNRRGYKDFDVLLNAFARLPSDMMLCAVGGGALLDAELSSVPPTVRERIVHLVLTDEALASAYEHAECFVFPSRYEGFGLPTLEAMAMGAPVILARASAHLEVGGSAALFFNPGDSEQLAEVLRGLLTSQTERAHLRSLSLERAQEHTWAATARVTAAAYRDFI